MRGPLRLRRASVAALLALTLGMGTGAATAAAASPRLDLGIAANRELTLPDRDAWLDRARDESATSMRIVVNWAGVSPVAPSAPEAIDPAWGGYRWTTTDDQVRALSAHDLDPILLATGAPTWAQAPGSPAGTQVGAWKPDPAAFGRFVQALAIRYSGRYPDPARPGASLPRVATFQLWNEPNLDVHLAPQVDAGKPFAPVRFRALVNAGYAAVKRVQPGATVVAGGLAPFGDYRGVRRRTPPVSFLRSMLCVGKSLKRTCGDRTTVDVLSQHPYAVRVPSSPALNVDDVTIPDLGKATKVIDAARRARTLGPGATKLWVTEVSYDSSPPDPDGVPSARLSRWTAELLWRLWSQGVGRVLWFQVRDEPPVPSYGASYQSGLYLLNGARKPSAQSFRFPLVVRSRTARSLSVWLRAPTAGRAAVQVRREGRWTTVERVAVSRGAVRTLTVPRARTRGVRAVIGSEVSYAWTGAPAAADD